MPALLPLLKTLITWGGASLVSYFAADTVKTISEGATGQKDTPEVPFKNKWLVIGLTVALTGGLFYGVKKLFDLIFN